jgi:hypothetical protein
MYRDTAAQALAMFGHSEPQVHPQMKLRAGNASAFLSGTWSAELAGLLTSSTTSGRKLAVGSSPGRKTASRHYQLSLKTQDGRERCELSGTMIAVGEDTGIEGGAMTVGTVTGTCSDSSLVLLVQWQEPNTNSDDARTIEQSAPSLTGCTLLHAVYGHRRDGQFCTGDRVRVLRKREAQTLDDQAMQLEGEIIESSAHSLKSRARKSDDAHGLAGAPQYLVQLIHTGEPHRSQDYHHRKEEIEAIAPTWHIADELMHAEHVVEIVGDGTLSLWTSEEPQCAVHFAAHRKVTTVSEAISRQSTWHLALPFTHSVMLTKPKSNAETMCRCSLCQLPCFCVAPFAIYLHSTFCISLTTPLVLMWILCRCAFHWCTLPDRTFSSQQQRIPRFLKECRTLGRQSCLLHPQVRELKMVFHRCWHCPTTRCCKLQNVIGSIRSSADKTRLACRCGSLN